MAVIKVSYARVQQACFCSYCKMVVASRIRLKEGEMVRCPNKNVLLCPLTSEVSSFTDPKI